MEKTTQPLCFSFFVKRFYLMVLLVICFTIHAFSQKEGNIWYFGNRAGLDFNSGTPLALTNGQINTNEGCSSMADTSGNLLFYTDGIRVFNKNHSQMPNGAGLMGHTSSTQSGLIIQKPGSTILYYIFSVDHEGGTGGIRYSEVNMSLNGGLGDITANKNILLNTPSCEKITAVKHCNNRDIWIITHDWYSDRFRTYLVTAAGVNVTPLLSNTGSVVNGHSFNKVGHLKASLNGKKLAMATYLNNYFELFDFDNTTGIVSNSILLTNVPSPNITYAYGLEFSPDGTKLYTNSFGSPDIYQYNLCAGSNAAIANSGILIGSSVSNQMGALQIGPDKKIYIAKSFTSSLAVINNPDALGTNCNFIDNGVSLSNKVSVYGLPNFAPYYFIPKPTFSFSINNCGITNFNASPSTINTTNCYSSTNTITSLLWNFGDVASGANNSSNITNPSHTFTNSGSYLVTLVLNYPCGADTIRKQVNISKDVNINAPSSICKGDSTLLIATPSTPGGTYLWNPGGNTTSSIYIHPTSTTSYTVTYTSPNGCIKTSTTSVTVKLLPIITINSPTICSGQSATLSANGAVSYVWSTGGIGNSVIVNPNATTTYSVTGTSNGCNRTATALVTVKPILTGSYTQSICSGSNYLFNGMNLTIAGSYLDTLQTTSGCDSIVTLNLIVNPSLSGGYTHTICSGSSYLFNGVNLTTAGSYLDTLSSTSNCDSIVTLNLTVNPTLSGSYTQTICSGFSYLFNGMNLTTSGSYLDTLRTASNCDSIVTLNLIVNPTLSGSYTQTICQGSTYLFNGVTLTTVGNYLDTLTSVVSNCDSIVTLNLIVNPTLAGSYTHTICNGSSYLFNGLTLTTTGSYLDTLQTISGCDSIVILNLIVNPTLAGSYTQTICSGSSYLFNGVNLTTAGNYLDTLNSASNCDSIVTLNLIVNPTLSGSFTHTICNGASYLFNGIPLTTAGNYLDTLNSTSNCDSIVTLNLIVSPTLSGSFTHTICQGSSYLFNGMTLTTAGSYLDTLSTTSNCDSIVTLNLIVNPTLAGSYTQTICSGSSYLFNGMILTTAGNYLDTFRTASNCDSIVTLNLIVNSTLSGSFTQTICNGSSYVFNGITLTTAGNYLDTLTSIVSNCDSVVMLNLIVNPTLSGNYSQTICNGSSYLFNGLTLTTTGSYLDTLQTISGCDSIVTLNLIVNPTLAGSFTQTICQGSSYLFNGVNLTTSGSYLDTLQTNSNCDSIVTLNLTVNPMLSDSFTHSICNGSSYLFNGVNLTTSGSYLDTLQTSTGCDSIITLNLSVNPTLNGNYSQSICSGFGYLFNGITLTTSGSYLDTLQTTSSCDSIVTLNLTVNPTLSGSFTQSICQGSYFLFNGANLTTTGNYLDTITSTISSCDSIVTLNLIVNPTLNGSFTHTICSGSSYLFNGMNLTIAGSYLDTLQTSTGCDSIVTLNLIVNPTLAGSYTQTICSGSSYLFNGMILTTAGSYLDTLSTTSNCDSIVTLNLIVNPTLAGSYTQTICSGSSYSFNGTNLITAGNYLDTLQTSSGCDSIVTLNLSVNPILNGNYNHTICSGSTYLFNGIMLTTGGSYLDTLQTSLGCDSIVTLNLIVNPTLNGNYTHTICSGSSYLFNGMNLTTSGSYLDTLNSSSNCDSIVTLNLIVNPIPIINISPDTTITNGSSITLTASGGSIYNWSPSTGLNTTTGNSIIASPTLTTTYCVLVTSNNGCSDSACVKITVQEPLEIIPCKSSTDELKAPNAFSPNGDGINDEYCLQGWDECIESFLIVIHDRWGERVFESRNPNFCWDGTFRGVVLDASVVVYFIRAKYYDQPTKMEKTGNISLIK